MSARFAVAGGGTGGHVTMALAIGEEMRRRGDAVLFVGARRGLETRLVPQAGFELASLPARPIAGQGALGRVAGAAALLRSALMAVRVLRRHRAQAVVSVGGYAAVPAAAAAVLLRLPLVLVEPNAIPGRTHRALGRFAARVFTAFASAERAFAAHPGSDRVALSGAPIEQRLLDAFEAAPARRKPEAPVRLLVTGGSQGARQLNDAVIASLPSFDPAQIEVFHQTGEADRERVANAYAKTSLRAEVVAFAADLPARYRWADLALCRAGALTVSELALAGLPALLVPYPYAADDHQRANALDLHEQGAARLLDSKSFDAAILQDALRELLSRPERLEEMGRRAAALARPGAAREVVDACHVLAAESRT